MGSHSLGLTKVAIEALGHAASKGSDEAMKAICDGFPLLVEPDLIEEAVNQIEDCDYENRPSYVIMVEELIPVMEQYAIKASNASIRDSGVRSIFTFGKVARAGSLKTLSALYSIITGEDANELARLHAYNELLFTLERKKEAIKFIEANTDDLVRLFHESANYNIRGCSFLILHTAAFQEENLKARQAIMPLFMTVPQIINHADKDLQPLLKECLWNYKGSMTEEYLLAQI